jgi:hypothetical protein
MRNGRGPTVLSRRRGATVLVFTCAAIAAALAGFAPAHPNAEPGLGAAFRMAVVLLVAAATSVTARPSGRRIKSAAGLLWLPDPRLSRHRRPAYLQEVPL